MVAIGRRKLPLAHARLLQVQTELTSPLHLHEVPPPTAAFSCLGTTIKKAGSRQGFRMVDHDSIDSGASSTLARR